MTIVSPKNGDVTEPNAPWPLVVTDDDLDDGAVGFKGVTLDGADVLYFYIGNADDYIINPQDLYFRGIPSLESWETFYVEVYRRLSGMDRQATLVITTDHPDTPVVKVPLKMTGTPGTAGPNQADPNDTDPTDVQGPAPATGCGSAPLLLIGLMVVAMFARPPRNRRRT